MEIQGAAAIVFGGASGLGEATARLLAAGGAAVTIADLNGERAQAVAAEVGGSAAAVDVRDGDAVAGAVELAGAASERGLRVCVCCAGVVTPSKLLGREGPTPLERFDV